MKYAPCDSPAKVASLLELAGFMPKEVWTESLDHRWQPEAHFEYQVRSTCLVRLQSLGSDDRETCLRRVRDRLSRLAEDQYVFRGEVVMATAVKRRALS